MRRTLRDHVRSVARIARWEVSHAAGTLDRRTAALGVVALLLAGGVVGAAAATGGVALDRGIYRVGVAADSPYHAPVADSSALEARPPDVEAYREGRLELLVRDGRVAVADSRKGQAALSTFRSAVEAYNDRQMAREENGTAAFPVVVTLRYLEQGAVSAAGGGDDTGASAGGGGGGAGGGADGDTGDGGTAGGASDVNTGGDGPLAVPGLGGVDLFGGGSSGSPADIRPPFPFSALVLAFAFLVPMNFVTQAYGSTMLNERINRRGELLLVTPVTPGDIVAGKTLPYLLGMLAFVVVTAVAVGGGPLSIAAVVPIALLFLAATFVGAMFARSFKELTFVTVAVSVFLTTYTFVPAIFTNVTPIAFISPLSVVVHDLQGTAVSPGAALFATAPFTLAAAVLFLLGIGVYREEDLFTQRSVPLKFLDALDSRISGAHSMAVLSGLSLPFVFMAELLAVAVLFALPVGVSMPLLLFVVAGVEEVAKSAHVLAGFEKARFERTFRTALVLGSLSGLGFFVGEKATAVVQLVGLPELALGRAAFAPAGVGVPTALLLVAPLVLHVVTAAVTATGAARNARWYGGTLVVATALHTVYNLTVVTYLG